MSMSVPRASANRWRLDGWAPAGGGGAPDGDGVAGKAATDTGEGVAGEPPDGVNAGRTVNAGLGAEPEGREAMPPPGGTVDRGGLLGPARNIAGDVLLGAGAEVFDAEENDPLGLSGAASSPPTAAAAVSYCVDSEAFVPVVTNATVSGGSAYSNPPADAYSTAAAIMSASLMPSASDGREAASRLSAASNSSSNESVSSCSSRVIVAQLRRTVLDNELFLTWTP
jgi:hypothetical protein